MANASWAGAQLPSSRNLATESMLQSAALGQAVGMQQKAAQKEADINTLRENILDAFKAQDRTRMMLGISELAKVDPDAATKTKDILGSLDRTNAFQSAMLVYTAAASDNPQSQDTALKQAIDALNVGPTHPFAIELSDIMRMPYGKAKDDKLLQSVQTAQALGLLPTKEEAFGLKPTTGAKDNSLGWARLLQEAKNQAIDNKRLQEQFDFNKEQFAYEQGKPSPKTQELYANRVDTNRNAQAQFTKFSQLADQFDEYQAQEDKTPPGVGFKLGERIRKIGGWEGTGKTGGFQFTVGKVLRNVMGWQQKDVDRMYDEFDAIKAQVAIENLPKGAASDQDIIFALRGTPPSNAGAGYVAQWLRGIAKLKAIQAAQAKADVDALKSSPNVVGYDQNWIQNKSKYISEALQIPEWAVNYDPGDKQWRLEDYKLVTKQLELGPTQPPPLNQSGAGQFNQGRLPGRQQNLPANSVLNQPLSSMSDIERRRQIAYRMAIEARLATEANVGSIVLYDNNSKNFFIENPNKPGEYIQLDTK